jgi:LCP family protein required for cell wall assembly
MSGETPPSPLPRPFLAVCHHCRVTPRPVWHWNAFASRFVTALVIFSFATASGYAYAYWFANDQIARAKRVPIDLPSARSTEPANYLIVGSDSRAFVHDKVAADHFGTQKNQPENLADVIMIAHVDPNAPGKGFLVSIPRDTWVPIAGHSPAKINAAFNYGPATLIETIQNNFHFPINHYLKLDFATFTDVVSAIGRVHIFFPAAAYDTYTGLDIKTPGCVALDGIQALAYARSRHYYYKTANGYKEEGTADLGRIQRQQYFIRSLAQEAIKDGARNPFTAKRLIEKIVPHLEVDRHMGLQDFLSLGRAFRSVDPGAVQMVTMPTTRQTIAGQDAQVVQQAEAQPILDRLKSFVRTSKPAPLPKIPRADILVRVLNGSGVKGAAGRAETALLTAGFANGGVAADADRSDYGLTEVRYPPGGVDKARVVAAYLGGVGALVPLTSTQTNAGGDVVVVLGRDFVGVAAPGSHPVPATNTTSLASTSTPPNPGTTPGVTAPATKPGRPAVGCG